MAEELIIDSKATKEEKYRVLIPQIKALIDGEGDLIANLANIAAALKFGLEFFWVGFYLVKDDELVLGPFQGPVACTRIKKGKGVCGTAWAKKDAILVPDVDKFPGHIACNSASRSEIVIPAMMNKEVCFILDVDSDKIDDFDQVDKVYLEKIIKMLERGKK